MDRLSDSLSPTLGLVPAPESAGNRASRPDGGAEEGAFGRVLDQVAARADRRDGHGQLTGVQEPGALPPQDLRVESGPSAPDGTAVYLADDPDVSTSGAPGLGRQELAAAFALQWAMLSQQSADRSGPGEVGSTPAAATATMAGLGSGQAGQAGQQPSLAQGMQTGGGASGLAGGGQGLVAAEPGVVVAEGAQGRQMAALGPGVMESSVKPRPGGEGIHRLEGWVPAVVSVDIGPKLAVLTTPAAMSTADADLLAYAREQGVDPSVLRLVFGPAASTGPSTTSGADSSGRWIPRARAGSEDLAPSDGATAATAEVLRQRSDSIDVPVGLAQAAAVAATVTQAVAGSAAGAGAGLGGASGSPSGQVPGLAYPGAPWGSTSLATAMVSQSAEALVPPDGAGKPLAAQWDALPRGISVRPEGDALAPSGASPTLPPTASSAARPDPTVAAGLAVREGDLEANGQAPSVSAKAHLDSAAGLLTLARAASARPGTGGAADGGLTASPGQWQGQAQGPAAVPPSALGTAALQASWSTQQRLQQVSAKASTAHPFPSNSSAPIPVPSPMPWTTPGAPATASSGGAVSALPESAPDGRVLSGLAPWFTDASGSALRPLEPMERPESPQPLELMQQIEDNREEAGRRLGEALGQRLIEQIEKGQWQMRLSVNPRELGPIDIDLRVSGQRVEAQFQVAHAQTQSLIQDSVPRLREAVGSSGMDLASVWVSSGWSQRNRGNPTPGQPDDPASARGNLTAAGDDGIPVAGIQAVDRSRGEWRPGLGSLDILI